MNETHKPVHTQVNPQTEMAKSASKAFARLAYMLIAFLFAYKFVAWVLASLFFPATTDLGLHAIRYDNATRIPNSGDNPWFISSGFIAIVRILRSLPYDYRIPAAHLLDDAILVGFAATMALWCRRCFGSVWPALVGVTFLISQLFESSWIELLNRDWYASMFSFSGILVAGGTKSRGSAILAGTLWMIGLQFRPQVVLLLPLLMMARAGSYLEDRSIIGCMRAAILDLIIGLGVGFVLVNGAVWLMGGFPNYYVDTFLFMKGGGHGGRTTVASILKNFVKVITNQNQFGWLPLLPVLLALSLQSLNRRRELLWLIIVLAAIGAATLWVSVNPIVNRYHRFPLFIAESIALAALVGTVLSLVTGPHDLSGLLVVALGFAFAISPYAMISIRKSTMDSLEKIRDRDYSPQYIPTDGTAFPPAQWKLGRAERRALHEYLGSKVDSATIPFEYIVTDPKLVYNPYFMNNPGLVGDNGYNSWLSIRNLTGLTGIDVFKDKTKIMIDNMKSVHDGFVLWIPNEANEESFKSDVVDITEEVRVLFDTIKSYYEPVARFGEIEIRRKKHAESDAR